MSDDGEYMRDPTAVLQAYLRGKGVLVDGTLWQYGRLAMALEVITVIRTLEGIAILRDREREATISVLHTLLVDTGVADTAYKAYEELGKWRRVSFERDGLREREHAGSADADARGDLRRLVSRVDDGLVSGLVVPLSDRALQDMRRALMPERRSLSQDASSSIEPMAPSEGEE